jgi:predicted secreted protein
MTLALGLALYFIIWWTTLFAVLPWGVRTQDEEGVVVPGTPESAPARPRLIKVVVLNTVVATIVFAMVWAAIDFKLIPIEDLPLGRQ